jgi:hypothetical protein
MTRAAKPVKIAAYVLLIVALVRLVIVGASKREADALSLWLVIAAMTAFWVLSWVEGVYLPLMFQRAGHEKEFVVIQTLTGAGIIGLCYLIATTF